MEFPYDHLSGGIACIRALIEHNYALGPMALDSGSTSTSCHVDSVAGPVGFKT